ncbi:MAG: 3D-(3,5/4)-trihydroxycyclohexane-1,2-dione acylhydrolase (decyclizing), partial [Solirubrobacterales bacterium]|nr:3D-(3,5/4)-trihydroxycyclohexane-1,2-dione acylhydrolase (decyclizing) [Solirubrobacterales bacterium]
YSAAEDQLRAFAEGLGIPVAETSAGKGSLTGSRWLVGGLGVNGSRAANELAFEADLVLCVGTRLTDFTTGSHSLFQDPGVRFVGVNVNAADAYKLSATAIVADAREALTGLRAELGSTSIQREIAAPVAAWTADLEAGLQLRAGEALGQGEVLQVLNETARQGDWVVAAAGWQPGDLLKLWKTPPGSFTHIEFGFSCMGHEIPAGLGVRMHDGDAPEVFVVVGDGTYLMNPTELVTATQERLKLTVVLLDNGGYQSISRLALGSTGTSVGNERRHRGADGRLPDGDTVAVDFVANARSMGCGAVLAESREALRDALAAARAGEQTTVIVCPTAPDRPLPDSGAFWDLGVPEVAASVDVRDRSDAHRERARAQRHY